MNDANLNNLALDEPAQQEPAALLRENPELAVLYAIAGYLNHQVDVREALQEILARVTELLHLQTGWVWLLNEQGVPYLAASLALPPYLTKHADRMGGSCLCLDTFLSGTLEGAANIDVLRCSRLKNAERDSDPSSLGLRFHASIPIYAGNTPLGILNVASEDWRELRTQELQLLHIISDQIGLAMQRARLSADATRSATRLATIEERNRLARDIHDTLAQGLAAITLQLEVADAMAETRPQRAHEAVQRALLLARATLDEARRSVMDLRAAPLQEHTLSEALMLLVADSALSDIPIDFSIAPSFPVLPARIEIGLYRVAQEALTNIHRHAEAQHVELSLYQVQDGVQLAVLDDGRGFDPEVVAQVAARVDAHADGHFGLLGMSERVKLMGGHLSIQSSPGSGTSIVVSIPLPGKRSKESSTV